MIDQLRLDGKDQPTIGGGSTTPVECMGMTFESDQARREYFLTLLAEKLKDSEYRKQPGFPMGQDEDILRMSDPPYYTACPNPFLADFVSAYGEQYSLDSPYHRDPFAIDVSVGKSDSLYKAHSYHTKVPHLAIVPSILHYTRPGDIVLDGFCGSGMTGVAAQFCSCAPAEYRMKLEAEWSSAGMEPPSWGPRQAILGDLSPAATFIAAGYNIPFDADEFKHEAHRILEEVGAELGWMYETLHSDGRTKGRINYTVWSDVFSCSECGEEIVFMEHALDPVTKSVRRVFECPRCGAELIKSSLEPRESTVERGGATARIRTRVPVLVNYSVGGANYEKKPDANDKQVLAQCDMLASENVLFGADFPFDKMWEASRLREKGVVGTRDLFGSRPALALQSIWNKANACPQPLRTALLYWADQAIWSLSLLNRYRPTGYSQTAQYMSGVYYMPSTHAEVSPWYVLLGKADRLFVVFSTWSRRQNAVMISTGDSGRLGVPDRSVDYVFVDPPFGENLPYSELNFLAESIFRVYTDPTKDAVVDRAKKDVSAQKGLFDYEELLSGAFSEFHRVLKPGRWISVVFSNSSNAVWRALQMAMSRAGFVVADVRTLDKQMGSFKQVTSQAVKQDLVVSAYKPSASLADSLELKEASAGAAWVFVGEHLSNVPVIGGSDSTIDVVAERTPQMLHDRMVGFFVQRGLAVPVSTAEFMLGLSQRYPERDGMYLLPEQVAEYDKRRARADSIQQLSLMVTDESSAIQWLRQQLDGKPQSFSELQPTFMREAQQSWAKHEAQMELRDLLEENFLLYDGKGPVPSQIKSYLSTNWREYRSVEADNPSLQAKAKDRWYVPDPGKSADLARLRERQLLREFEHYRTSTARKIRLFRTEAVRVGFKRAYDERDWETIVAIAERLPDSVVQEDEKLLMYYDVARMRVG